MFSIARAMLEAEHERLLRDHYDDKPIGRVHADTGRPCEGCTRAYAVAVELAALGRAAAMLEGSER